MMLFFTALILIIAHSILFLYNNLKRSLSYFDINGIPYIKPNWILGNMTEACKLKKPIHAVFTELYETFEPYRFAGVLMLQKPTILIRDPELLKNILTKDFAYFQNRGFTVNPEVEPLMNILFVMKGDEWKRLRMKLITTFTLVKMKMMFPLVKKCAENLRNTINKIDDEFVDIKDLIQRYFIDSTASCAFGVEANALEDPQSDFAIIAKKILEFRYKNIIRNMWPTIPKKLIQYFGLQLLNNEIQDFFINLVRKTVKHREENNITRNDFIDLMIALKNNNTLKNFDDENNENLDLKKFESNVGRKQTDCDMKITEDLIAAQCFLFFTGGFETSTTALSFLIMELARNKEIQEKVRSEIEEVLRNCNNDLTYDSLKKMTYTDMAIAEILRKYPPTPILLRQCNTPYHIPGSNVIIPNKSTVIVPVMGLHNDRKYYEKPNEFYPEHFTHEANRKRPHYAYLPFGKGPRNCLGERFGRMQVKLGLIMLLQNFSFEPSPNVKYPPEYKNNFLILKNKDEVLLKCRPVDV